MADVAGCYEDVPETSFVSQPGTIGDVLDIGEGFGVGVGNAWAMVFPAEGNDLFGLQFVIRNLRGRNLRDVMILTVQTTEIATCAGQREARGAGMKVVEWFLLDRVNG